MESDISEIFFNSLIGIICGILLSPFYGVLIVNFVDQELAQKIYSTN